MHGSIMTIRTASIFALCALAMSAAHAQVEITETQRYIDANTFVLNEPCLEFNGTKYKGQFLLDQSAGLTWKLLNGEELTEERNGCISVEAGDQPNEVRYNIGNLVVADGNMDTGQRYDALSTADATRLDLGFAISNAVTSPPSLVVPTSTQTPLYFTNEKYGEGLDVCLSAVGADSITISNANNSVDLTLSSESTTGIKKFCGNIAQDKLEYGDVFYNAKINDSIELAEAVSYWNPKCEAVGASICGQVGFVGSVSTGQRKVLKIQPLNYNPTAETAYVEATDKDGNVTTTKLNSDDANSLYVVDNGYSQQAGMITERAFLVDKAGRRSLTLGELTSEGI